MLFSKAEFFFPSALIYLILLLIIVSRALKISFFSGCRKALALKCHVMMDPSSFTVRREVFCVERSLMRCDLKENSRNKALEECQESNELQWGGEIYVVAVSRWSAIKDVGRIVKQKTLWALTTQSVVHETVHYLLTICTLGWHREGQEAPFGIARLAGCIIFHFVDCWAC